MMAAASDRRHLDVAQREARTLRLKVAELERGILLKSEHSLTLERELMVRVNTIAHARIKCVGKSQSCMV